MQINKEMLKAEFESLLHIAKFTESDFITSPFRKEFLEYALTLIEQKEGEGTKVRTRNE